MESSDSRVADDDAHLPIADQDDDSADARQSALTRLSAKHLDDLYGTMKKSEKTPKTMRNHHAILSAALHQAARCRWVRTNVAEQAKPPRVWIMEQASRVRLA